MEQLNSKIYAKYENLKKRKLFVEEELNHKIDSDIRDYQSSAIASIQQLKDENARMREEMHSLQEQYYDCLNLVLEENRTNKKLSNEVSRLQSLLSPGNNSRDCVQLESPCAMKAGTVSIVSSGMKNPKSPIKDGETQHEEESRVPNDGSEVKLTYQSGTLLEDCCRRRMTNIENEHEGCQVGCVFKDFIELLVGMKISINNQFDGLSFFIAHERSGYEFSLKISEETGDVNKNITYQLSSLGTLEIVALDWMREEIVFGITMLPVFFQRISKVIGHHR